MAHRIEAAKSGRAKCQTCSETIAKGETRIAELYVSSQLADPIYRFHHLPCAAESCAIVLRQALAAAHDEALIPDRAALDAQIEVTLEAERARNRARFAAKLAGEASQHKANASASASGAASAEAMAPPVADSGADAAAEAALLARLADAPDDEETQLVLADLLQSRGDVRGELILVQRALKTARPSKAGELVARQAALTERLAPPLNPGDHSTWAAGFVRRLELAAKTGSRLPVLPGLFRHASLGLLQELAVDFFLPPDGVAAVGSLADDPPITLRRLELGSNSDHRLGPVARLLAALPRLAQLALAGRVELATLAHPRLARLELPCSWSNDPAGALGRLSLPALPALTTLAIRKSWHHTDAICAAIGKSGWLARLDVFELTEGHLGPQGIDHLAAGLAGRKLARLDVSGNELPAKLRRRLEPLCERLVAATAPDEGWWVVHLNKPEWGRGKVLRNHEGKLEIEFEQSGKKVFKADASFLKSV